MVKVQIGWVNQNSLHKVREKDVGMVTRLLWSRVKRQDANTQSPISTWRCFAFKKMTVFSYMATRKMWFKYFKGIIHAFVYFRVQGWCLFCHHLSLHHHFALMWVPSPLSVYMTSSVQGAVNPLSPGVQQSILILFIFCYSWKMAGSGAHYKNA